MKLRTEPLAAMCEAVVDCPHSTPVWTDSGFVVLRNQNIKDGRLDLSTPSYTDEGHFKQRVRRMAPRPGDIVITREAPMGEVCKIPEGLVCCLGQRQVLLRPKAGIDPDYLLYALQSPAVQDQIRWNEGTGSTVSNIRIPVLEKIEIPRLDYFEAPVARTLRSIDEKIDVNKRINQTLEAMAQAIFKSWFVDFDPVKAKIAAKQEGRDPLRAAISAISGKADAELDTLPPHQYKQLATTAALFPDEMDGSELGEIPRGWSVARIQDVVEGVYDGPHATPPEADEGAVFLGIRNMTGTSLDMSHIRYIADADWAQWTRRVEPRAGDIVFSYEATLGYFAILPPSLRCCLGRRLALIRPRSENGFGSFWFHQFVAPPFQRYLEKHTIPGATVNRIALKDFPSFPVLEPTATIQAVFSDTVNRMWSMIHTNQTQSQALVKIRDSLLPKLLSGELSVESLIEAPEAA